MKQAGSWIKPAAKRIASAKSYLAGLLPRSLRPNQLGGFSSPISSVWVVRENHTATIDYLVAPAVSAFNVPVRYHHLSDIPPVEALQQGTLVVLVRYVNDRWKNCLDQHAGRLAGIVYFMDDDLLDAQTLVGLPGRYVKKISRLVGRHRDWLLQPSFGLWVSTPLLADKYAAQSPQMVQWAPDVTLFDQVEPVRLCYHGSSSHIDEQRWLRDVVGGALENREELHFEIVGDMSINRMFRQMPRVTVLHPMSWTNYLAFARGARRDIGLAPLLPTAFNAARGPTKFYDLARMGAVGLYSNVEPYGSFINHDEDGLLLANNPEAWVEAVTGLVDDPLRMRAMAHAARTRARSVRDTALPRKIN